MADEAVKKTAKPQYKKEDIKFNEKNKTMAIVSCLPLIGLIMLFVEKDDTFVRYYGALYAILGLIVMVFGFIPVIQAVSCILIPVEIVLIVIGMVKASKGEVFELPLLTDWALKLMSAI